MMRTFTPAVLSPLPVQPQSTAVMPRAVAVQLVHPVRSEAALFADDVHCQVCA